ncbi:MAG: T9SS type A sorting domain-containing protein [Bacteroidia bacterium]|nr:T9SS type A sorting domain-containing protein [Bacteroidia bacterium]
MKKIQFTCLLFIGLVNGTMAQQVLNQNFEQWDTIGDYTQPSSWFTLNQLTVLGFEAGTTLDTQSYSGNFAVRLETKTNGAFAVPGLLSTGPVLNPNLQPDFSGIWIPFNYKPDSVVCYVKAAPQANDSSVIAVQFTRWNQALSRTDTVGGGAFYASQTIDSFTRISFPVEYDLPFQPDTMMMIATSSASRTNPITGSWLVIDEVIFVYNQPTSLHVLNSSVTKLQVYPNPCSSNLHVNLGQTAPQNVKIINTLGQLVSEHFINAESIINVGLMQAGAYLLVCEDGSVARFVVQP